MFGFRPQGPELPRHGGVTEGVRQDTKETGLWMPSSQGPDSAARGDATGVSTTL